MKNQRTILLALALAWTASGVGAEVQTNDVHQQAVEVLRKAMGELKTRPKPEAAPRREETTFDQAERLYLEGKIKARDFQKYLEDHKLDQSPSRSADAQNRAIEVLRNQLNKSEAPRGQAAPPASGSSAIRISR